MASQEIVATSPAVFTTEPAMNRFTLRFKGPAEHAFYEEYFRTSLWQNRATLVLFVMLAGGGGISLVRDLQGIASTGAVDGRNAFTLYVLAVLALSFAPYFKRVMPLAVAASSVLFILAGTGIVGASFPDSDSAAAWIEAGEAPTELLLMLTFLGLRVGFVCVGVAAGLVVLTWSVGTVILGGGPFPTLFYTYLLGMVVSYFSERYQRREFVQRHLLQLERQKSDRLLLNVLPQPIADRLKEREDTIADDFEDITVLFADVVNFTVLSASMEAKQLVEMLDIVFTAFDRLTEQHGLEKIKTIGDCYMVVGGLPVPREDHVEVLAEMALGIQATVAVLNAQHGWNLEVRIGLHCGPAVAGVIGRQKFIYDLWGDTVNTASRMESTGIASAIQVTSEVYERLKDTYAFTPRGLVEVKGKGEMRTYLLTGRAEPTERGTDC